MSTTQHHRRPWLALGLAISTILAGCAVAPPTLRPTLDATQVTTLRAADFPAAATLLDGIAEPDDDPALRVGDAALLALEFRRGARIERQLLLLEVVELPMVRTAFGDVQATMRRTSNGVFTIATNGGPPRSRTYVLHDVLVRLRRFTANGRELARADVTLYEEGLRAGWWPETDLSSTETDRAMTSMLTFSLQNLANGEPTLQEALFLVVDPPSLWSLATHLGVQALMRTSLAPPVDFAGALPASSGAATHVHRIDLDLNGEPSLEADLLVVKPRGATMLCGGLVGAIARNPNDAGRSVVARLLATRRGPTVE
ncbi:MAG: hypothetical protein R3F29_05810 [Planctomycetota bacterium]